MSKYSFGSSILSTLTHTSFRRPFDHPSTLLCIGCHSTLRPPPVQPQRKSFTTTPHLLKKQGGKGVSKNTVAVNASKTANDDAHPTDFTALETQISVIIENLREEVRNIKAGGVNVEAVEDARVVLKSSGGGDAGVKGAKGKIGGNGPKGVGGGKEIVQVKDLCQIVPRGRLLVLMVGEKEALEIHIPIPPTTGESRNAALSLVSHKGDSAIFALREARGAQRKRLRRLALSRKVGPDMLRKAEKELEKVNEGGVARVKKVVEERRKGLGEG
ncbi:MAG: hypothetical protein Q9172_003676 [Xanthocarpia lactea]